MRRLRQVALVAEQRDPVVEQLRAVFGVEVGFNDPGIERLGLVNAVIPFGDQFLEVIAPTRDGTQFTRYLQRRGGPSGYMLIVQTDDHAAHLRVVDELGVRIVARFDAHGFTDAQLHPADTGGTFLEIDQMEPPEDWEPAGRDWRPAVRTELVRGLPAAVVACHDPDTVARRWSALLRLALAAGDGGPDLALDDAVIRFRPIEDDRGEGLASIDVAVVDPAAVLARAAAGGIEVAGDRLRIGGLWMRPVPG
jgi:hypothetical protein